MAKHSVEKPGLRRERENLRRRVRLEREKRGWSRAHLSRRHSAVGCKLSEQDLYTLEGPGGARAPRAVKVDELAAFAEVFGLPITDLLTSPDDEVAENVAALIKLMGVHQTRLREAYRDLRLCMDDLADCADDDAVRTSFLKESEGLEQAVVGVIVAAVDLEEAVRARARGE